MLRIFIQDAVLQNGQIFSPWIWKCGLMNVSWAILWFNSQASFANVGTGRNEGVQQPSSSAAAAAKSLQSCPTLCDPIDSSPGGSPVPGILQARTLEWLPFPSPMHESEKWEWSRSVVSNSSRPYGLQPTRLLRPWDFPGKSTGVGCHCLLPIQFWYQWNLLQANTASIII